MEIPCYLFLGNPFPSGSLPWRLSWIAQVCDHGPVACLSFRALEDRGIAGRRDRDGHRQELLSSLDVMGLQDGGPAAGREAAGPPQGLATALQVCSYLRVTFLPSNVSQMFHSELERVHAHQEHPAEKTCSSCHSPVLFHVHLLPSVIIFSQNRAPSFPHACLPVSNSPFLCILIFSLRVLRSDILDSSSGRFSVPPCFLYSLGEPVDFHKQCLGGWHADIWSSSHAGDGVCVQTG